MCCSARANSQPQAQAEGPCKLDLQQARQKRRRLTTRQVGAFTVQVLNDAAPGASPSGARTRLSLQNLFGTSTALDAEHTGEPFAGI